MARDMHGAPYENGVRIVIELPENGPVLIPDGQMLFEAEFVRSGPNLLLKNPGNPDVLIVDYFRTNTSADLQTPEGGILSGTLVETLAGPIAPGRYAQAGAEQIGGNPIGQVETVAGGASVQRTDGTVEELQVGSKIFLNDVLRTTDSGALSVTFIDGTIFTLSESSRMVVDELIYTVGNQDNSASFSLIQGGFVFIAGQVAGTGGMEVSTPAATMGIRGTTVHVESYVVGSVATSEFTLTDDFGGGRGSVELYDRLGNLITTIRDTTSKWVVAADGVAEQLDRTAQDLREDDALIDAAFIALESALERVSLGGNFVELDRVNRSGRGTQGPVENGIELDQRDSEPLEFAPLEKFDHNLGPENRQIDPAPFDEGLLQDEIVPRILAGSVIENDAPMASGTLLSSDTDVGAGAVWTGAAAGTYGAFTINATTGAWTYTLGAAAEALDPGQVVTESFTATVTDDTNATASTTVQITVTGTNDVPVVTSDTAAAQGAVTEDSDPVASGQLTANDADAGAVLNWTGSADGTYGAFTINATTGAWTYTLGAAAQALAAGQIVTESFTATVSDGLGGTAEQTVTLTVTGSNDGPVIDTGTSVLAGSVIENDAPMASGTLLSSDTDVGAGAVWTGAAAGTYGAFTINATTGAWTYTLGAAAEALDPGQVVTESFTATVTDDTNATASTTVQITVTGTNDVPVVTSDTAAAQGAVTEDSDPVASGQLTANDADAGAVLNWTGSADGTYGAFTINATTGAWTYTLGAAAQALAAGQIVTESFTATVSDGLGGTAEQTVTLTVTGSNDGPVIDTGTSVLAGSVIENDAPMASGTLLSSDTDVGAGAVWTGAAAGTYGAFTINATTGAWTYTLGAAAEALDPGQVVTESFTATVTDDTNATASTTVQITVTGTNDVPVVTSDTAAAQGAVTEDSDPVASGQLTANDADAGAVLNWTGSADGTYGAFTINATTGAWTYTLGAAAQALAAGQIVTESFTATVSDGLGGTAEQTVTLTVTGSNDGPVIDTGTSVLAGSVIENDAPMASGTLLSSDTDVGAGAVWTGAAAGTYGAFTINATTGAWTYTLGAAAEALDPGQVVTESFTATVTDDTNATASTTVQITVTGTNDVPVVTSDTAAAQGAVTEDSDPVASGQLTANDADAGAVLNWTGSADGTYGAFTINATTGAWTYTLGAAAQALAAGQIVTESFTATVSDGLGGTAEQTVTLTVTGSNDGPVIDTGTSVLAGSVIENDAPMASGTLLSSDTDVGAGAVWTGAAAGTYGAFTINATTGAWTYTLGAAAEALDPGQVVTESFTATVTDDTNATASTTVQITVTGTNDVPVVTSDTAAAQGAVTEDSDPVASGQLTANDADAGAVLNWTGSADGTYGAFTINATTGAWTYTLGAAAQALAAGQIVTESFTATVSDGLGGTAEQTVTLTVTGSNDGPVIDTGTSVLAGSVIENDAPMASGTLLSSDTDVGAGAVWTGAAAGTYGAFTINATTGAWTYTLGAAAEALDPGQVVTESFTATVTDDTNATASTTVQITVTGTNDVPVVTSDTAAAQGAVTEDSDPVASGQLTANDADAGAVLNWTGSADGTYGAFTINATTGAWTYTLGAAAQALAAGQIVTESFTATVSDGLGGTAEQTVTLTVTGSNDGPVIDTGTSVLAGSVIENDAPMASGTLLSSDTDVGAGAVWTGAAAGTYGAFTINATTGAWTYTLGAAAEALDPGQVVTESFTATVTDDTNATASTTVQITVTGTNDVPVVTSDTAAAQGAVTEDSDPVASGQLTANDADAGAVLNWTGSADGTYGAFTINATTGAWTYTLGAAAQALAAGQIVTESFTATVSDGLGGTAEQTVTLTVTGSNDGPVIDTGTSVLAGSVIENDAPMASGTLLSSDTDVGAGAVWTGAAAGTYGAFTINATTGAWTYTLGAAAEALDPGQVVTESFTATVTDDTNATASTTVQITVTGTNDVPVVTSDTAAAQGAVTEDSDPVASGQLTANDADAGAVLNWTGSADGTYGAFTINATTGAWTYTLGAAAQALAAGQIVTESFTATVSDGLGGTAEQTVTLTVTGSNDGPVIDTGTSVLAGSVIENDAPMASGTLLSSDTDVGAGAVWTGAAAGTYGAFTINATTGAWTYTLGAAAEALDPGQVVTESFTATVTDDTNATASTTVQITVTGTNDVPVVTSDTAAAQGAVTEDSDPVASGQLTANDADAGAVLNWTGSADGTYGAFTINATTGAWTYTLGAAAQALAAGQIVTESFTATVSDGLGGTAEQTVTLTVTGSNDGPVIDTGTSVLAGSVIENDAPMASGTLLSSDTDVGAGAVWTGAAAGTYGAFTINATTGAWTYTLGAAAEALDPGQVVTESFTATVTDDTNATASTTVQITVTGTNDVPVVTSDTAAAQGAVTEDSDPVASGQLTANDADAGAVLNWTGSADGTYGAFTINATTGAWTYTLGAAAQALAAGQIVTESFTATVSDGLGGTAEQTVTLTVTGSNDGPVIDTGTSVLAGSVIENDAPMASGTLLSSDTDVGAGAVWTGAAAGTYGAFTINATTGAWTYTLGAAAEALDPGQVVTESFTATVTDDTNATASTTVQITVTGTNDVPVVTSDTAAAQGAVTEDSDPVASGQLTANDADAGAVLNWTGSADGTYGAFTINATTGAWTYTLGAAAQALAAGQIVTESFTATVSDGLGGTAEQTVTLTVTGSNDGPVIDDIDYEIVEGGTLTDAFTAIDIDLGDTLTYTLGPNEPSNGSVSVSETGVFTYTPDVGYRGLDRFDYSVSDGKGGTDTAQVTIAVESESNSGSGGQEVTLNIYPDPDIGPAGSVVTSISAGSGSEINLVVTVHRSGSLTDSEYNAQLVAIADALDTLAGQFAGSASVVNVSLLSYSDTVTLETTLPLDDANLRQAVLGIDQGIDGNNWEGVFQQSKSIFDAANSNDSNFLYFITDGVQIQNGWKDDLAALTNSQVDISAFGIGQSKNFGTIRQVDPDAVLLETPADLTAAFNATPLFSAKLVSLSVTLIADGGEETLIADASSDAVNSDNFETTLALADIVGIADLLGDENRVSALAGFDLDGDISTTEIELFSSEVFAKQAVAQIVEGVSGSDLLFGSDQVDVLNGNGGNDVILGFGGDDQISTGAGLDVVRAGDGNDRIAIASTEAAVGESKESVDGGEGRDVLDVDFGGDLNSGLLDLIDLSGIEVIDMANGSENTLALTLEDIQLFSNEPDEELAQLLSDLLPDTALQDSVTIYSDSNDTVKLIETALVDFEDTGLNVIDSNSNTLSVYTANVGGQILGVLAADSDVVVIEQASTAN